MILLTSLWKFPITNVSFFIKRISMRGIEKFQVFVCCSLQELRWCFHKFSSGFSLCAMWLLRVVKFYLHLFHYVLTIQLCAVHCLPVSAINFAVLLGSCVVIVVTTALPHFPYFQIYVVIKVIFTGLLRQEHVISFDFRVLVCRGPVKTFIDERNATCRSITSVENSKCWYIMKTSRFAFEDDTHVVCVW